MQIFLFLFLFLYLIQNKKKLEASSCIAILYGMFLELIKHGVLGVFFGFFFFFGDIFFVCHFYISIASIIHIQICIFYSK
jgi:hypothetical protein